MPHPSFHRYIGIDYSGARTPDCGLKGLRVYAADRESLPVEVLPLAGPSKYEKVLKGTKCSRGQVLNALLQAVMFPPSDTGKFKCARLGENPRSLLWT